MSSADYQHQHAVLLIAGIATALVVASLIGRSLKITVAKRQPHPLIDNLNTRVNAWWVIAAVVGTALLTGRVAVTLLFACASFVAVSEYTARTRQRRGDRSLGLAVIVGVQYLLVATSQYVLYALFLPVFAFTVLPLIASRSGESRDTGQRVGDLQWGLLLCVYCISHVPALLTLNIPGYDERNVFLLVYLLIVVQSSDVLQYVWGKLAGRRRIAPRLSPSKTVEGTVGGVVSATILGAMLAPITPFTFAQSALVSLVLTLLGVLGGLLLSGIKRRRRLKDWGNLINGHGGVLDRLDSLCLSAPVFYYVVRYGFGA